MNPPTDRAILHTHNHASHLINFRPRCVPVGLERLKSIVDKAHNKALRLDQNVQCKFTASAGETAYLLLNTHFPDYLLVAIHDKPQ